MPELQARAYVMKLEQYDRSATVEAALHRMTDVEVTAFVPPWSTWKHYIDTELMARRLGRELLTPEEAWEKVDRMIAAVGAYQSPVWDDPFVGAAAARIGWLTLCRSEEGETWLRRRFEDTYRQLVTAHVSRGVLPEPVEMLGLHSEGALPVGGDELQRVEGPPAWLAGMGQEIERGTR
jgi:hypothetical protein